MPSYHLISSQVVAISFITARMYLKSIALFVVIYGRVALAALPLSCQEGEAACATGDKCTPLNTETIPTGVGEVWYSQCCTVSEQDNATPPVTTTKQYCYSYSLQGYPNNQFSGIKPACSKTGSSNNAWSLYGQCSTSGVSCPSSIYLLYVIPFISTLHLTRNVMSLRTNIVPPSL